MTENKETIEQKLDRIEEKTNTIHRRVYLTYLYVAFLTGVCISGIHSCIPKYTADKVIQQLNQKGYFQQYEKNR